MSPQVRRLHSLLAVGSIGVILPLAGCGTQRIEEGRIEVPARVTASADPSLTNVRPLPQVITKPKPFRLPDVIARVPSLEPVTMTPAVAVGSPPAAPAPLEFPADRPAVAEVAAMFRDYLKAFNRHDATALAAHWSATAENVDLDSGETTRGREAVGQVFTALFAEDEGATFDIDVESIRPVRSDVVLVDGISRISFTDGNPHGSAAGSRFSAVVVKQDGRWLLESVREASLAERSPTSAPPGRPLDALGWLVGSWEDVGEGVTAGTQCFWSPGRAFLVRSHIATFDSSDVARPRSGDEAIPGLLPPAAEGRREFTEIIGWDPDLGRIRSWLFTSEGRFAEGTWTPEGRAWRVDFVGQGQDVAAVGSLLVEQAGPDEMSIRCVADGLADVMPPACDFVRTARLEMPD